MKFVILQCTKNLKGPVEVTQLERQPLLMFLTLISKTARKKVPTDFLERRKQLTQRSYLKKKTDIFWEQSILPGNSLYTGTGKGLIILSLKGPLHKRR